MGGLTGAGGSTVAQTERRGATAVEQRSSRWRRQGGRGSSQRRCGARGGVEEFRGGPGRRFTVAQRRRHDITVAAKGWRRKRATHREGCSFYSHRRRLANGGVRLSAAWAAAKPWAVEWRRPRSERGRHGRRRCSDRVPDERGPRGFVFSQIIQTGSNLKIENRCLSCSKNSQILHVTRLGYYEELFQLCRHPILNRIRVKNLGTDSTFESLMNFKRGLILLENLINSPKFLLDLIFTKVNLVGSLVCKTLSYNTSAKRRGLNKIK
jgi:hypothetical protein